ncbi:FAD-dependent oxidoreductase, partial [Rhizobium johnstonii]
AKNSLLPTGFAGEATSRSDFSTAHGAWESGIRAAREFVQHNPQATVL